MNMAYKVVKTLRPRDGSKNLNVKEYICDTPDDVQKLPRHDIEGTQILNDGDDLANNEPCDYGSSATVGTPFSGYTLYPNNQWKKDF